MTIPLMFTLQIMQTFFIFIKPTKRLPIHTKEGQHTVHLRPKRQRNLPKMVTSACDAAGKLRGDR